MIDLLIDLVTPLVTSFGASPSDVSTYMNMLSGYIYGILILIVALIAVMVGAHFVKKGTRHVVRWTGVVAFVLVLCLIVNMICFGPMYTVLNQFMNAKPVEISDDVAGNSWNVSAEVSDEGIVLLKNNGLLPLSSDVTALNVFGWASTNPVYSGTGSAASGDAAVSRTTLLQSLENAGYALNGELSDMYTKYRSERPGISMNSQDWTLPEPTKDAYTSSLMSNATSFSDTAVIVISRSGGENADLPADMNAVIKGTYNLANTDVVFDKSKFNYGYTAGVYTNNGSYDDFEPGEHYLELSRTEEDLVDTVCSNFNNVILVVNANNAMELGWVEDYDSIGAVILLPGTGDAGMGALGRVLNGTVNPSGKTVDTFVRDLTNTPTFNNSGNSGNHLYTDGLSSLPRDISGADMAFQGVFSFVDYVEGIYMGYKYYETASDDGVINYDDYVLYPFGYGLSYTTFSQSITNFSQNNTTVTVEVTVKNEGDVAGKDVVELYYTPPYTNGGIEKASVNLIDFGKTGLLEPGASEKVTLTVALEDLASYDSSCIKTANGGYILEAGEYTMSIRSDSHTVLDSKSFTLNSDIDYSADGRSSDKQKAENQFDYMEGEGEYLSRKDGFANYAKVTAAPADDRFKMSSDMRKTIEAISVAGYDPTAYDDSSDVMPTQGASGSLTLADLTGKPYDDPDWDALLNQMSVDDMVGLVNQGGWQTVAVDSVGKIATTDCDGPAGLSNYITGASGTQFPMVPMMSQTWSKELAEKIGDAMGQEFAAANNFGWYGPAMNLHRSAFSGRNFEYYSEDGVLSGIFASAQVNAAARYGVYAYIKHFAGNDQETNRCAFLQTYMTEQTFRENVLRPFETVVKNFDFDNYVLAMMTAYNWLGTVPVISNSDLLTTVLRNEWGFVGMVISDYNGSYGYQISDAAVRAGNDLMLGQGMQASNQFTDLDSASCVLALRRASKNILYTVGNSGYYADPTAVQASSGSSGMTTTFVIIDIIVVVLALGLEAFILLRWSKKRKNS